MFLLASRYCGAGEVGKPKGQVGLFSSEKVIRLFGWSVAAPTWTLQLSTSLSGHRPLLLQMLKGMYWVSVEVLLMMVESFVPLQLT